MAARAAALEAEAKERRDLALLTAYYTARLQGADFKQHSISTFDRFRAQFDAPARLSDAEIIHRLDAMAARGVITKH
ncbi:hypothetical protein ACRAQ6_13935 [Erythrobacter sp. HA6-11]